MNPASTMDVARPMTEMPLPRPGVFPAIPMPYTLLSGSSFINELEEKKKEFSRGLFVSGFEKTVTTAMLQRHFNIKPIYGLRHPTNFTESKGFAFIYYGS